MLIVTEADLDDPALAAFLGAHLADIAPTAPAESRHALNLDGLRGPGIRVWTALDGDQGSDRLVGSTRLVGTVALAPLDAGRAELKSMRTEPACRGRGIASTLLRHALADASNRCITTVLLETGSMDFFAPARALYEKFGFVERGPFGHYAADPNSIFLQRSLDS